MRSAVNISVWIAAIAVIANGSVSSGLAKLDQSLQDGDKPGRCPTKVMDQMLCPDDISDQCHNDRECHGSAKCCSTGCAKVCVIPSGSGCQLSRQNIIRRGRALGLTPTEQELPKCAPDGTFDPIQCHSGRCFCVDVSTGFETPGTRARSLEAVNCSQPLPCAGYQCRMLCPFEFDLDNEGCPLCKCHDPCQGVACPGDNSCVMEEVECVTPPCPALPTCKQLRSLSNLCPLGDPLLVDNEAQRPYLCGVDAAKPTCPSLYKCQIKKGHEYGVCCAAVDELVKPGTCPADGHSGTSVDDADDQEAEVRCGVACEHDLQCPSTQKCCKSSVCGQHCIQPTNLTACLQQRMIAELLIASERAGKGYVPQCRESDGMFEERQCSRNGLVCWCVRPDGRKLPRSVGAAQDVNCTNSARDRGDDKCVSSERCSNICEYGYALDSSGCTSCECQDPCTLFSCPTDSHCIVRDDPSCRSPATCPGIPVCVSMETPVMSASSSNVSFATSCPAGKDPLTFGNAVGVCGPTTPCPLGYTCIPSVDPKVPHSCCPDQNIIGDTKPGQCPFIRSAEKDLCFHNNRCYGDGVCPGDKKCCVVADCGYPVCVDPAPLKNFTLDHDLHQGPTMCEYLRDLVQQEGVSLAMATPSCDANGAYESTQCNSLGQCWCVDDFGTDIPGTKVSSRELIDCERLRLSSSCGDAICRLGCDYGFALDEDTACPVCECRDPCKNVDCGALHECQMIDVPCIAGICPSIPQCVPSLQAKISAPLSCPKGAPYLIRSSNVSLSCSSVARALECPKGYACHADENAIEGICCPSSENSKKEGQCPYLMPMSSGSCDLECSEDVHCQGDKKCCSNGCGTHCIPPIQMTACQHQRALLEFRAREAGIPSEKVYLPACDSEGAFVLQQCHPGTLTCWCVDEEGSEVAGTRVSSPAEPNCQKPLVCPAMNCNLACLHGYQLDSSGCPICACRDPCSEVTCNSQSEECRIVRVACVSDPCPPVTVCLPKLDNPCVKGSPLTRNGSVVECGPRGKSCPSSHKCHLSPLWEFAVCCPKPRDECFKARDQGDCEGSIQRWFFNRVSNRCEKFRFGGCGGNLNNFESREECEDSCPPFTSCQQIRQRNLEFAQKDNKMAFLPKCDQETGDWLPEQCLEELGVCWCVSPEGDQMPGSLTRGVPSCHGNARSGRVLNIHTDLTLPNNMICEPDQIVHVCDKSVCDNKVCLSHPSAVCRVNPCDGCSLEFLDAFNSPVSCEVGLTHCQKKLQKVLNSEAYQRPSGVYADFASQTTDSTSVSYDVDLLRNVDVYYSQPPQLNHYHWPQGKEELTWGDRKAIPSSNSPDIEISNDHIGSLLRAKRTVDQNKDLVAEASVLDETEVEEPEDRFSSFFTSNGKSNAASVGMALTAPQCHSDGSWAREQRSGDLVWCVDAKGRALHETLTRGHVRCGPNGQIMEQISLAPVCPGGIRPMVCTDECLTATCKSHQNVVCIADPCNQCRVSFHLTSGEVVNCERKCSQPVATGMCRASFKKYFYNSTANVCQEFIYGGCQGNDNNFPTMEECQTQCAPAVLPCDQAVQVGECSNGEARWYYNSDSRKCEIFLYSGCGGNDNNFKSKENCENICPDLITCPYWSVSNMEPKACSRSEACSKQTCHGYPDTICKVDPCSCIAHFFSSRGERVSCMMATEEPKTRLAFTFEEDSSGRDSLTSENRRPLEPVTIFLEGEPSLTRCELLQRHLRQSNSKRYVAQCDDRGRFIPTQCYSVPFVESFPSNSNDLQYVSSQTPSCWCVDEIGRKTQPTVYFNMGERECEPVSVESVMVTLGFRSKEYGEEKLAKRKSIQIKKQVGLLLKQLEAITLEDEISVIDLPDLTQVKFTLLGGNKVDVAYQLEDQVRRGGLTLAIEGKDIPADLRASWFHHQVSESRWNTGSSSESHHKGTNILEGHYPREVVTQPIVFDRPYLGAAVIFTVISALVICGLIMAAVLYRRHTTGQYPKAPRESLQSLAFSDCSLDRRSSSVGSRSSNQHRRSSSVGSGGRFETRRPTYITTIEEEYRSGIH